MENNETQSNKSGIINGKQIPTYPKNGDCHIRILPYEWDILTTVCSIRACGINEAINWVLRTHISRAKDPEIIADMLTNIGSNIEDIICYIEDIQNTGEELTMILRNNTI
jgi:hypothetical protein